MRCPECGRQIAELFMSCDSCGYIFDPEISDKFSIVNDLKKDFQDLQSVKDDLERGLDHAFSKIRGLKEELMKELRERIERQETKEAEEASSAPEAAPVSEIIMDEQVKKESRTPVFETVPAQPVKVPSQFELKLGQKWLLILGIVTMVFGVGYFLKYSFERGWIGPAGRVALAYIWGIVFLIGGDRFRKKLNELFGLSLVGGGIATLYFAAFAGFQIYHLMGQTVSFSLMLLITVLACVLSIFYDNKWLAILGLVGGFFTPVMLSTGQDNQIFLMTYMTILNAGLLGIALYKRWNVLNVLGFAFTYLLYTAWFVNHYTHEKFWPALVFINIFFAIYSIIPFLYQFAKKKEDSLIGFSIITPNAFIAFGYSYAMISTKYTVEWVGVVSILYAAVFLFMATFLYRRDMHRSNTFALLIAKTSLFLIITIPIILSKHWITIFWMTQAGLLLWMGIKLERKSFVGGAYALCVIAMLKFFFYDYNAIFGYSTAYFSFRPAYVFMIVSRYVTTFLILVVLYRMAMMLRKTSLTILSGKSSGFRDSAMISGLTGVFLFVVLNIEVSAFFFEYLARARYAAVSVLWTAFSVALMIRGFRNNISMLRRISLGLFSATLLKVFLFDMAKVNTPYRILSFILLGVVMIATSYLYYRYKDKILEAFAADSKE